VTEPAATFSLVGVAKRFPGVLALDDVSLAFRAGEVHVLLGENGAGKSTLVGLLAGLQMPDVGHLAANGQAVRLGNPRQSLLLGIGTVFQQPMLAPSLTVAQNMALGGSIWRRPDLARIRARIAAICTQLGISLDPDAKAGDLSLGEQQMADIVRALLRGGRLLILDEATSMLPPREAAELGRVMRQLAAGGMAVLFITHKLAEAMAFGDRISVLRHGRLAGAMGPERLAAADRTALADEIVRLMFGEAKQPPPPPPPAYTAGDASVLQLCDVTIEASSVPVRRVDLAVAAGEIFGLAGIDGNGQKQLAEAIAGQVPVSAGRILLAGQDIQALSVRERQARGLRYVSDDRMGEGSIGEFPVMLNLLLKSVGDAPFWRRGVENTPAIRALGQREVAAFDVRTPSVDTPIGKLSGGNIQKVVLARELSGRPRAIVFAKPTHGLDVQNTAATRGRIRDAAASGMAVMLISADLDEIFELSHRVGVMQAGCLVGVVENGAAARRRVSEMMSGGVK